MLEYMKSHVDRSSHYITDVRGIPKRNWNFVFEIGASVKLKMSSQAEVKHKHEQTHTHAQTFTYISWLSAVKGFREKYLFLAKVTNIYKTEFVCYVMHRSNWFGTSKIKFI